MLLFLFLAFALASPSYKIYQGTIVNVDSTFAVLNIEGPAISNLVWSAISFIVSFAIIRSVGKVNIK